MRLGSPVKPLVPGASSAPEAVYRRRPPGAWTAIAFATTSAYTDDLGVGARAGYRMTVLDGSSNESGTSPETTVAASKTPRRPSACQTLRKTER